MTRFEDGIPSASCSEMSYDPYGDVPAEYMNPPPLTLPQHIQQRQQMPQQQPQPQQHMHMQSTSHMPYGNYAPQQNTIQQQQQPQAPPQQQQQQPQQVNYVNIVHPSGRTVWVQVREGATLAQVKEDACRQLGLAEIGPMTRVTPMLDESAVDRQCMPNDTLYILPTTAANKPQELPSLYHEASQPVTPLVPSMPTTPLSAMSGSFTSAMYAAPHPTYSNSTPLSAAAPCGGANWQQPQLDDKLAAAASNLSQVISQSRQCTELQQDLEAAVQRGVDCSAVFQACERMLPELVLHPSGNYLISKCFELCPSLADAATAVIASDVRTFALHKHGSYVVEAILVSNRCSKQAKSDLISALLGPTNRVSVATHDSGNFVLQKAIEFCPDELLFMLQEAVQAVFRMSTHGPKMMKKLESRMAKSQHVNKVAAAAQSTLPLPASTVAYVNHVNAAPTPAPAPVSKPVEVAPTPAPAAAPAPTPTPAPAAAPAVAAAPAAAAVTTPRETPVEAKAPKREMRELPPFPEGLRAQAFEGSWADADDGPLSPPPMHVPVCP